MKGPKTIEKFPKNPFHIKLVEKLKKKITLKQSVTPESHFPLTDLRVGLWKKMVFYRNSSSTLNNIIAVILSLLQYLQSVVC